MKYNFKVKLTEELYKIFLENDNDFDIEYFNTLKDKYNEFRINYNDSPTNDKPINLLDELDGESDNFQILLKGISSKGEKVLCYYFVGEDYGDNDEDRKQALEDFKKILKFKIT